MKFGVYLDGILIEKFNTPEEAYEAGKVAFEESGLFHEIKLVHPFEKRLMRFTVKMTRGGSGMTEKSER